MIVIHDQILSADAASFDVQNIPQSYKHLEIYLSARAAAASSQQNILVRFNNDSGNNYTSQQTTVSGASFGGSALSGTSSMHMGFVAGNSGTAGHAGGVKMVIPDYARTSYNKTIHSEGAAPLAAFYLQECSGIWVDTDAITRIQMFPDSGNWLAGSRLTIYGIGGAPAGSLDAANVAVQDSGGNFTATDVEGVLAEIAPQLGSVEANDLNLILHMEVFS
jgi:hypothetical protein